MLKIARVLPILKPKKNRLEKSSYRPISNLNSVEKVFESYLKDELENYFTKNQIIIDNHHGGRKGRSTVTAKAVIEDEIGKRYEESKITAVLSSDLSMAFDTVDHFALIEKMEYYGIKNREKEFFQSYLSERMQYVEINTKKSKVRQMPPCSVIQGSRLSGFLYTVYTNEIPLIKELMKDEEAVRKLLGEELEVKKDIDHETINYVDDSYNVIAAHNAKEQ